MEKIILDIDPNQDKYTQWCNKTVDLINNWTLKSWDLLIVNYLTISIIFKIDKDDRFKISIETELPESIFRFNKHNKMTLLPNYVWELIEDDIDYHFIIK